MKTNVFISKTEKRMDMDEGKNFYIVDKKALPDIFLKVMDVKKIIESGEAKSVQEAVLKVGLSRSAFYKYRDCVYPLYENSRGKTVTFAANLEDISGLLSTILNIIAAAGANILTINQNIPMNGIANVTITIETNKMENDIGILIDSVQKQKGVRVFKIIARE